MKELESLWHASKQDRLSMVEMNYYVNRLEAYIDCFDHLPFFEA